MKDGAHTHHHGHGALVLIVAGLAAVAVCTGAATAFVGALASLLVTLVVTLGVVVIGVVVIVAVALALLVVPRIVRWRDRRDAELYAVRHPVQLAAPVIAPAMIPPPPRQAVAPVHIHFHGLPAAEQVAIIRQSLPGTALETIVESETTTQ